ncbi:jg2241 [Pararge aegeria aegeria]|uniref:Jg2241 protein n=1 Tax=Pararge aegeria aegeria TaxID=348720 RepID=A0A8S4SM27_9NEOP|nr:jg2241 [Pararge aegeria aegeria]
MSKRTEGRIIQRGTLGSTSPTSPAHVVEPWGSSHGELSRLPHSPSDAVATHQCCPHEEAGKYPIGLFAFWPMIKESVISLFKRIDDIRQNGVNLLRFGSERMRLTTEATHLVTRNDFTPRPQSWLWCSDEEDSATFAFKPCPADLYLDECLTLTNVSRKNVLDLMEGNWWGVPKPKVLGRLFLAAPNESFDVACPPRLGPTNAAFTCVGSPFQQLGTPTSVGFPSYVPRSFPLQLCDSLSYVDKANVEKTINKCLYKTAHDPVETAWNYLTCFRTNLPTYAKIVNRI